MLRRWPLLVGISLIGIIGAVFAASQAGRTFLPEFNEGALTVSVVTFPGTELSESEQLGGLVESMLLAQPEVVSTARRTGRAELDEHAQGMHSSEIEAQLAMRDRSEAELLAALREDFATVPGVNIVIGQPISHRIDHMISGTRANIAVKVFGPDLDTLRRVGEAVKGQMEQVPGVVDLAIEEQTDLPVTTVRFDRDALARHGLTVHAVAETIETAFRGQVVSQVLVGAYAFDLAVF